MAKKLGADEVRSSIRNKAAELFTKNGIHASSLNDIARESALSKGTIYYYYPSKEALLSELAQDCTAKTSELLYTWLEGLKRGEDVHAALLRLLSAFTDDPHNARFHTVLCTEAVLGNEELQSLLKLCYREWCLLLEIGSLKIRTRDSALLRSRSRLFFTILEGNLLLSQGDISRVSQEEIANLILG